MFITLLYSRVW